MSEKRRLRVREYRSLRSYEGYQLLQERRWWGWKTLERVDVPECVYISLGAFGDTGGWVSPFARHGRFGRDGLIEPIAT
jgi:hypothetical protein